MFACYWLFDAKLKLIVTYSTYSVVDMGALKEKSWTVKVQQHSLLQDSITLWNTTFMFKWFKEQRWAFHTLTT